MKTPQAGFQLAETLIVSVILVIAATLSIPPLLRSTGGLRVQLAAAEISSTFHLARAQAIRLGVRVAVKFETEENGRVTFTLYRDGDGDGVRSRDIRSGVDTALGAPRRLAHLGGAVRFGFPEGVAPRDPGDPGRRLDRLEDPLRFNRSDLASFDPLGTSTPGSAYLTDGRRALRVVRLFGRTGKIKILTYNLETERWR